jgi:predicted MFS family arabinose efflux permease
LARAAPLLGRAFVLGFVANFLHSFAFHAYVQLPGYLERLGADEVAIGTIVGSMAAVAIVSRPYAGRAMDRRGRRVVAIVGSVVHVIATASYLAIDSLGPGIYAVRAIHGVAEGLLFSVLFTIAADVVPRERRTEGIALFGISGMLPLSLAGIAGDAILASAGYRELFLFTGACALAGLVACLWLPESRPSGLTETRSFVAVVRTQTLRMVWLVGFGFAVALASYFAFLKTYMLATEVGTVGGFFTAYALAAIALRLGLGWLPDRIGAERALLPALACTAVGLVLLGHATGGAMVIAAGLACGAGHGFAFPILSALVVARAAAGDRGVALSVFTALFDLGLLVGGPALGLVVERSDYTVMFDVAAAVVVVALVAFAALDRRAAMRPHPDETSLPG